MYVQVEKAKENKSKVVANVVTQKKGNVKQGFGFVDNRPEAIVQRKMDEGVNSVAPVKNYKFSNAIIGKVAQCMSWQESKALKSSDYDDPVADGVSDGGVWMYILKHKEDSYYDIRVHFHAGSSRASKAWTVRWNNEGSGNNIATQKWMRDRVSSYYESNQEFYFYKSF